MAELGPIRRTLATTLARRDAQLRGLADLAGRLAAERERLKVAQAAGDADVVASATARIWDLGVQRAAAAQAIQSVQEQLRARLDAQVVPFRYAAAVALSMLLSKVRCPPQSKNR